MALIKWEPFGDIDRLLEDFPVFPKQGFDLAVDVYEKNGKIIAEMNLPGIDPEKIGVSVEDNYLRVAGSREESKEEKQKRYYSKEIRRGSFERIVRLPAAVERNKVSADYKNGMLTITMPKKSPSNAGKVKVQVAK